MSTSIRLRQALAAVFRPLPSAVQVHAFDRCGSGVSEADPDLGSGLEALLAEIDTVVDHALAGQSDFFLSDLRAWFERQESR